MCAAGDVGPLVEEYRTLLADIDHVSPASLGDVLIQKAGWTSEGAAHLAQLARGYGAFVLRNALALSLVLGVEDGDLGL